ncbi:MAG: hypothetical protein V7L01_04530 [Nostoc sp.]|uniref:hypothetical protein n=1 Tax=Nostoc sp. TaxID=1180 RepID=UPI002FF64661
MISQISSQIIDFQDLRTVYEFSALFSNETLRDGVFSARREARWRLDKLSIVS